MFFVCIAEDTDITKANDCYKISISQVWVWLLGILPAQSSLSILDEASMCKINSYNNNSLELKKYASVQKEWEAQREGMKKHKNEP